MNVKVNKMIVDILLWPFRTKHIAIGGASGCADDGHAIDHITDGDLPEFDNMTKRYREDSGFIIIIKTMGQDSLSVARELYGKILMCTCNSNKCWV